MILLMILKKNIKRNIINESPSLTVNDMMYQFKIWEIVISKKTNYYFLINKTVWLQLFIYLDK